MSRAFVHASGAHTPESLALRQVPVRTASVRPVSAWTVQLQRGDRCACGGGCPRCQESSGFQPRLAVNHPGDLWEQEADRIAEAVVDTPEPLADPAIVPASGGPAVAPQHRQTAPSLPEQPQPVVFASEPQPDMPLAPEGTEGRAAGALAQQVLRSNGSPLGATTRALVERRFGRDFQQVRVHTDHLLLFHKPFADHLIHRRLRHHRRDGFPIAVPIPIVGNERLVDPDVPAKLTDGFEEFSWICRKFLVWG